MLECCWLRFCMRLGAPVAKVNSALAGKVVPMKPPCTLKRYRSGGEQTVREAGRQSSAMSLTGGGARQKRLRRPHERGLSVPKEPALLRDLEANQTAVHGSRRDRLDRLPFPWSAGRRTEGRARHVSAMDECPPKPASHRRATRSPPTMSIFWSSAARTTG